MSELKYLNYKGINTKGGEFEVIAFGEKISGCGAKLYTIRFPATGYITYADTSSIKNNSIIDPFIPSIYGVGYIGNISIKNVYAIIGNKIEYYIWRNIISRCYNKKDYAYKHYGAKGITVCERWHSFENFVNDLPYIPGFNEWRYNPKLYHLDKDTLQKDIPDNQKIYSKETCIFVPKRTNILERHKRSDTKIGYIGVEYKKEGTFSVRIEKDYFGTYTDPIIAANVYNHVARYRGYPEEYLNNVQFVPWMQCMQFRVHGRYCTMVDILDKQKHKCITDISDLKAMCKIVK